MKLLIYGINGTMGKTVYSCIKEEEDIEVVCGVDSYGQKSTNEVPIYPTCNEIDVNVDCIIDFSIHNNVYDYIPYAIKNNIPSVIATTGFNEKEQKLIDDASKFIPIFQSGNMSIGINLLIQLIKKSSQTIGDKADIEIIEMHHNKKIDAPSGTALMLANEAKKSLPSSEFIYGRHGLVGKRNKKEIGIHSIRGGSIVGKHQAFFIMNNEIITLSHEAESKSVFALGSINAALYLINKPKGKYSMEDMLG